MDPELDDRLATIERRQRYTLLLVGYPYLVGLVWLATGRLDLTSLLVAVTPAIALVVVWYVFALGRARRGDGTPEENSQ